MADLYNDTFAGSGALGNIEVGGVSWEVLRGTAQRSGGRAVLSNDAIAVVNTGTTDVDITMRPKGNGDGIVFRAKDSQNYTIVYTERTSFQVPRQVQDWNLWFRHGNCPANSMTELVLPYPEQVSATETHPASVDMVTQYGIHAKVVTHQHAWLDGQTFVSNYLLYDASRTGWEYTVYDTVYRYNVRIERFVGGVSQGGPSVASYLTTPVDILRVDVRGSRFAVYVNGVRYFSGGQIDYAGANRHGIGHVVSADGNSSGIDDWGARVVTIGAPTIIAPSAGQGLTTPTPTLTARTGAYDSTARVEYQLATDTAFTENVKSVTEPISADRSANSTHSLVIPAASMLSQGTWYIRARSIATEYLFSDWTAYTVFSVSHPPGASNLTPSGGAGLLGGDGVASGRFSWSFVDPYPSDTQSAFQIQIERNDTTELVHDSGKQMSSAKTYDYVTPSQYRDVPLRWRLKVWDAEGAESPWTPYAVFIPSLAPVVTITTPANGGIVASGAPTVQWTFSASLGRTQYRYSVVFKRTSDNVAVFDSQNIFSPETSYTPTRTILSNAVEYQVTVTVVDSNGLVGTGTATFTTEYIAPDPITFVVDSESYESDGFVKVSWEPEVDPSFSAWRIYRRDVAQSTPERITEISDSAASEYKDYLAPSQSQYEYSVVQVVDRFGERIESTVGEPVGVYLPGGGYWLVDEVDPARYNARLYNVTQESFKQNRERAEVVVVGRGRHVDVGENAGMSGTMTAQLRASGDVDARQMRAKLDELASLGGSVYLRNPFGDVIRVSIGDPEYTRIPGVGLSEFVDVTISYSEVF